MLESIPCGMTHAGCSAGLALDEIAEFGNAGRGMPRLREIREARGLSQAKLADLVGASQPQIGRLEKGRRRLTGNG